jgi:hypothetical protein
VWKEQHRIERLHSGGYNMAHKIEQPIEIRGEPFDHIFKNRSYIEYGFEFLYHCIIP